MIVAKCRDKAGNLPYDILVRRKMKAYCSMDGMRNIPIVSGMCRGLRQENIFSRYGVIAM